MATIGKGKCYIKRIRTVVTIQEDGIQVFEDIEEWIPLGEASVGFEQIDILETTCYTKPSAPPPNTPLLE